MNRHTVLTAFLLFLLIVATLPAAAQDDDPEYTCDEGENDVINVARAALEAGEVETAEALIPIAQEVCASAGLRFREVMRLENDVNAEILIQEEAEFVASAEPGLVDIGDYSLFLVCEGESADGMPTLVFENGSQDDVNTWEDIQPTLAENYRTCRYNRLGMSRSDDVPSGVNPSIEQQAADLHNLLATAEIEGPYVLIGHSIGGYMLAAYPHLYPEEVAGLVFVDANHPEIQHEEFTEAGVTEMLAGTDRMDMVASAAWIAENVTETLDIPLAVLAAERRFSGEEREEWMALQNAHLERSTNSELFVVSTGHYIQNSEPEATLEAIEWVLQQIADAQAEDE